jgi:metal-responsive CopG/Arc/MetJ family transcriptional regulator
MVVRKTVDIDDDLKAEIDKLRNERGLSMKEIINEAMRLGLREIEKEREEAKRLR